MQIIWIILIAGAAALSGCEVYVSHGDSGSDDPMMDRIRQRDEAVMIENGQLKPEIAELMRRGSEAGKDDRIKALKSDYRRSFRASGLEDKQFGRGLSSLIFYREGYDAGYSENST